MGDPGRGVGGHLSGDGQDDRCHRGVSQSLLPSCACSHGPGNIVCAIEVYQSSSVSTSFLCGWGGGEDNPEGGWWVVMAGEGNRCCLCAQQPSPQEPCRGQKSPIVQERMKLDPHSCKGRARASVGTLWMQNLLTKMLLLQGRNTFPPPRPIASHRRAARAAVGRRATRHRRQRAARRVQNKEGQT